MFLSKLQSTILYKTISEIGGGYILIDGQLERPVYFETPLVSGGMDWLNEENKKRDFYELDTIEKYDSLKRKQKHYEALRWEIAEGASRAVFARHLDLIYKTTSYRFVILERGEIFCFRGCFVFKGCEGSKWVSLQFDFEGKTNRSRSCHDYAKTRC
ncbi:hypothetical protein [Brevibacillus laterosporus]|uniref:hypothetical protein n=1 Tax=Brevibacillus laterosporus TaxID=1465 RepID=UPI0013C4A717|nr:hypothetical protein [Brevibacillus laterosporus]